MHVNVTQKWQLVAHILGVILARLAPGGLEADAPQIAATTYQCRAILALNPHGAVIPKHWR